MPLRRAPSAPPAWKITPSGQACLRREWHSQCQLQGEGRHHLAALLSGVWAANSQVLRPEPGRSQCTHWVGRPRPEQGRAASPREQRRLGMVAGAGYSLCLSPSSPLSLYCQQRSWSDPGCAVGKRHSHWSLSLAGSRAVPPLQARRVWQWSDPQGRGPACPSFH